MMHGPRIIQSFVFVISVHKQIRLPPFLLDTDKMLNKKQVAGSPRLFRDAQIGLLRRPAAFTAVALDAGANQIFPGIGAAACFRQHVIDGKGSFAGIAVLATESVAPHDVPPG